MKYRGVDRLKSGDFNTMNVETLADGSQMVTLVKDDDNIVYKFKATNLFKRAEKITEYQEIKIGGKP
jgi:hypothetical protein